ncbi:MAG: Crp/Fnr family transcriptional regulator [Zetaproteobacteria bacterium]|nr:MAG: Crp/Fnr family transcriptional regulator [Zetaproteobacteria bacterium]
MITPEMLSRSLLFAPLAEAERAKICARMHEKAYPAGAMIFAEGDAGDALYLVLEGEVKIGATTPDGHEIVYAVLGPGAFFGELALIDGHPRSAYAAAITKTRLAVLARERFEALLDDSPAMARALLAELAARLRRADRTIVRISGLDAHRRVCAWLLDQAEHALAESRDGRMLLALPAQQLIADQISTSRETVARALSKLRRLGVLAPAGGRGRYWADIAALREIVASAE